MGKRNCPGQDTRYWTADAIKRYVKAPGPLVPA